MNLISKKRLFLALGLALLVSWGCDDDNPGGGGGGDGDDLEAPQITMDNVSLYDAIVATFDVEVTASDDIAVAQVDLLVDGETAATSTEAPFTISWDSTSAGDGIVTVSVMVTDTAGKTAESDAVDVVVINDGEVPELTEGNEGSIVVPDTWALGDETDIKHHWTSAADGYSRIIAIVLFEAEDGQEEWQLVYDIGTGTCPHSGESLDQSGIGTESPFIFDSAPDGGYPGATAMFVHIKCNPADHIGEELPYEMLIFAFN